MILAPTHLLCAVDFREASTQALKYVAPRRPYLRRAPDARYLDFMTPGVRAAMLAGQASGCGLGLGFGSLDRGDVVVSRIVL
jgi:hypothetical protein